MNFLSSGERPLRSSVNMFLRIFHRGRLEGGQAFIEGAVERGAVPLETTQIFGSVVSLALLPAAPEHAQTLEGHHAKGRPSALALAQLRFRAQAGPVALAEPLCDALTEVYFTDRPPSFDVDVPDWPRLRAQVEQVSALLQAVKLGLPK